MKKVLINFAHPAKSRSKINKALREAVEELEGVTVNDLYANYPDFLIDIKREQELCKEHDVIIFQHPFYWYSAPAIVQEWFGLVLEHGWAYGSKAEGLKGKIFMQVLSAGGDQSTYNREGINYFTINELTSPFKATATLCKMKWIPAFTVLGIHRGLPEDKIRIHAENYRRTVIALREGKVNFERCKTTEFINSDLNSVLGGI